MASRLGSALHRLALEPPFRIAAKAILSVLPVSVPTRSLWGLSERPAYLLGVLTAAEEARAQGVPEISVVEFGVAGGSGLVALQHEAAEVERHTGIKIKVFGFDMGPEGLPSFIGDYRDHPDVWKPGDYPMDHAALRNRLTQRSQLLLGNVKETVPRFFREFAPPPLGFISIDVDLYSSARDALQILCMPETKMLRRVPVYFDDIGFIFNHRFAGEFLAIEEFNRDNENCKIDQWHGLREGRPFPEKYMYDKLFVAHDLGAITRVSKSGEKSQLPLR